MELRTSKIKARSSCRSERMNQTNSRINRTSQVWRCRRPAKNPSQLDTTLGMSSINSLRYIRDYLKTKDHTKMIPNVLRPGGAELKPRGSISMAMAKVNKPAALIIGVGAMFVFGINAASHPGGGSVIEQEVKNIKETPTTWSG